jgi:histidine ammonia-lyase
MTLYTISSRPFSYNDFRTLLGDGARLKLSEEARARIVRCRAYLDQKLKSHGGKPPALYGINTGFGALHHTSIPPQDLERLQRNLVMSHACGTGEEVPREVVRLMLLLKIKGLSYGHSGVQLQTVQRLVDFFNADLLPVVYQQGSLGASGDLAPLAHLSLPLIGEGEVVLKGRRMKAAAALKKMGWKPVHLQSKEGLALLNGTQFMSAYGLYSVLRAQHLSGMADRIACVSLDAYDCRTEPFHPLIQEIRPHRGQADVARNIRGLLKGSRLASRKKEHVQDPYSFRCIPQVHGASLDAIRHAAAVLLTEANAVTDNPTVFPKEDLIVSAGNFHGQPLALAMDYLAMALSELGNISERRTYQLISGSRGLPPFLVAAPGLNSGFMIPQYTAASIVSQNKQLCMPASVDSIVSSNGQEDHVSMGANAATKLLRVAENLQTILAIELFTAAQALDFRRPERSSAVIERFVADYRKVVSFVTRDRILYDDIRRSRSFID